MADANHRFKIVCDLEVSGNCPIRNGVISACILVIDENNNVVDEFNRNVRPPDHTLKLWSYDAQGIHGMTFEQVETFTPNAQFCYELLCFLAPYRDEKGFPIPFICHASASGWKVDGEWKIIKWFDYFFLEWCFRKATWDDGNEMVWKMYQVFNSGNLISTVEMGRKAGYKGNKLNQWAERLGIDPSKHHDARFDTYVCLEVYKHLTYKNGLI